MDTATIVPEVEDASPNRPIVNATGDALSVELVEDELLMEVPVAPMHAACPQPVKMSAADAGFEEAAPERANPFAVLGKLRTGKS